MKAVIDLVTRLTVREPKTHLNLAVFPILNDTEGPGDYLTLDEALSARTATITEVSTGGSVPELRFANGGDRRVFLLDGEELVGAKQNRVLNLSIMVPPGITIVIPVSCVERGRWSYRSREFSSSPRAHHAEGRAKRVQQVSYSMRSTGVPASDQGEVWNEIDLKFSKLRQSSPTHAMADMFESSAPRLEEFVRTVDAVPGQVGAVFAVDGIPVGMDVFDSGETFRKLLPKLVRSYALDALGELRGRNAAEGAFPVPSRADAEAFLRSAASARETVYPGTGEGEDVRLNGQAIDGAALVVDGRVVHMEAFRNVGEGPAPAM